MYKFSKMLGLVAFVTAGSTLFADIKEMTPGIYKEIRPMVVDGSWEQGEFATEYYAAYLTILALAGAIDAEGNIIDHEIVKRYTDCVANGNCSWPTRMEEEPENITVSPDRVFKLLRAAIGLKNLNAQQATEAAEKTQQWCDEMDAIPLDEIPMNAFFSEDKHAIKRNTCIRLKGFYEEAARVQQNPESEEAKLYNQRLNCDQRAHQDIMARFAAAQQN